MRALSRHWETGQSPRRPGNSGARRYDPGGNRARTAGVSVRLLPPAELPLLQGPFRGAGVGGLIKAPTVTALPRAPVPWLEDGVAQSPAGGRGQAMQLCLPPALSPVGMNEASQTKSLFLPVLHPLPRPSSATAKIKTRNGKVCSLEGMGRLGVAAGTSKGRASAFPTHVDGSHSRGDTHLLLHPRHQLGSGRGRKRAGVQNPP